MDIGNKDSLNFGVQSFSVAFWVKNPPSTFGRVISKMGATGTGDPNIQAGWYVTALSTGVAWGIGDGTNVWIKPTDAYSFASETWYLIVGVFDRENGKFRDYVNGELLKETDISIYGSVNNNRIFYIGRRDYSNATYFNGYLDEIRVYSRALSPDEIKVLYQSAQ